MAQSRWRRLLKHLWLDESDTRRAIPDQLVERLARRVAASEQRHSGEIRIYVEAGLPLADVWRGTTARERALTLFGELGVWDTEQNNGVLVYLLLAEHAIEIVADRGLNRHVAHDHWEDIVHHMEAAFREGRFEDGLTQALEEVSALLVRHFPQPHGAPDVNELPDQPVRG
jgi:uncharacterized membrane protein